MVCDGPTNFTVAGTSSHQIVISSRKVTAGGTIRMSPQSTPGNHFFVSKPVAIVADRHSSWPMIVASGKR